jgi:SAM-dependent methyltransferase
MGPITSRDSPDEAMQPSAPGHVPALQASPDAIDGSFELLHQQSADPWSVLGSWYERRKRAITLAALPEHHLGAVLDVGCSVGVLTADLAARARRVIAVDRSEAALAHAARRLAGVENVQLLRMRVPEQWPGGSFDTIVLSEVCFFLDEAELRSLAVRAFDALRGRGSLLMVHWRHAMVGWRLDADAVHGSFERFGHEHGYRIATHLVDQDFRLDLQVPAVTPSLATREGKD